MNLKRQSVVMKIKVILKVVLKNRKKINLKESQAKTIKIDNNLKVLMEIKIKRIYYFSKGEIPTLKKWLKIIGILINIVGVMMKITLFSIKLYRTNLYDLSICLVNLNYNLLRLCLNRLLLYYYLKLNSNCMINEEKINH